MMRAVIKMCLCNKCVTQNRHQFIQETINDAAPQTILDFAQIIAFVPEELYIELQKAAHVKVLYVIRTPGMDSLFIATTRGDISCNYWIANHECVLYNWDVGGTAAYYTDLRGPRRYRNYGDIRAVSTESDKRNNSARIFHWLVHGTTAPEEVEIGRAISATLPQPIAEEIMPLILSISTDRGLAEYGSDETNAQIIDSLCQELGAVVFLPEIKYDTRWEYWRGIIISDSKVS